MSDIGSISHDVVAFDQFYQISIGEDQDTTLAIFNIGPDDFSVSSSGASHELVLSKGQFELIRIASPEPVKLVAEPRSDCQAAYAFLVVK